MAPLRAKITELIAMPMGPARSGSRECINSFGKKVGQETDSLKSSSLIPALKPFRSRLAEVAGTNTALACATYDIDGGQPLVAA
jgi:hypothetical protein